MKNTDVNLKISKDILQSWQEIVDILAEVVQIPVALIMRYTEPHIEVLVSSNIKENPYNPGDKNRELTDYVKEIQALRGMVPICSYCKKIRDDQNNWHSIEHYLSKHSEAKFSHGICPECMKEIDSDLV